MRHCDYDNPITLTAEEAVRIGAKRPVPRKTLDMIEGMREEFFSIYKDRYMQTPVFYTNLIMFFVWNAGRIEGIRGERKRRKQAAQKTQ